MYIATCTVCIPSYECLRIYKQVISHTLYLPSQIRSNHGIEPKEQLIARFLSLASKDKAVYSSITYSLSGLMSLLTLPPALVLLKWYRPRRDRLGHTLWMATQINSWWHFGVFIASYQVSFSVYQAYLADAPQEVSTVLLPYATIGHYFVLALGGMFLLELPLVMWYIARNVLTADSTRRTCSFHCNTMANSFGLTGIVFYLQIIGGYSVFLLFGIMAMPIAAIYSLALHAAANLFFIALIAVAIYPCSARRLGWNCFRECGVLLYIFLGSLCVSGFIAIVATIVTDNLTAPLNSTQIATSILSSCLFAVMGYIVKKTLWKDIWKTQNTVKEDEETALLYLEGMQNEA